MEVERGALRGRHGRFDPAAAVHLATLAVGLGVLLWWGRGQWFAADEWAFLTERRDPSTLLLAHVGHWSTIPHLTYQGLYRLVGLRDYTPYLLLHLLVHLGIVHVGWRLAVRAGVGRWIATAAALVLLFLGAGAENVWWGFQVGLDGSVLAGLSVLLLLDRGSRTDRGATSFGFRSRRRGGRGREVVAAVVLTLALMLSGVTIAMVSGVAAMLVLARGWRSAVRVCAVPTLVQVVWATTVWLPSLPAGREPGTLSTEAVVFAGRILATTLAAVLRAPASVGAVLLGLAALTVVLATLDQGGARRQAAVIGAAVAAVVFALLTGISRAGLGPEAAGASRYVYVTVALLWPLVAVALGRLARLLTPRRPRRTRRAATATSVVVVGLLVLAGVQADLLRTAAVAQAVEERRTEREVVAAARVLAEHDEVSDTPVLGDRAQGLTTDLLRELIAEDALREDVVPESADLLSARAALLVRTTGTTDTIDATCRILEAGGATTLELARPATLTASADAPTTLRLLVTRDDVAVHRPRVIDLDAGTTGIAVDLTDATVTVEVPPQAPPVELCGPAGAGSR